jgi:hypothetical protein
MLRKIALTLVAATSLATAAMTPVSARGVQHLQSRASISNAGGLSLWGHSYNYCYWHPYRCQYR